MQPRIQLRLSESGWQLQAHTDHLGNHSTYGRVSGKAVTVCAQVFLICHLEPLLLPSTSGFPHHSPHSCSCLCERCDSVRFPDAGNAPGSSARVPTSGLAATEYALHLEGARAGRPPTAGARVHLAVPACHLRLGGLPAEAAAELALRGSSVRGARRLPATAPAPPHLTHSRPSEQKLGARSW